MIDLVILRMLKHREHYERIMPNLPTKALDQKTRIILEDFGKFLKETGHPVVKIGPFKTFFFTFLHPTLNADQQTYYNKLLDNCEKDVDQDTVKAMNNRLVELSFATDIGNIATDYHKGDEIDVIEVVGLKHEIAKANILSGNMERIYVEDNIDVLLDEDRDLTGLQFRLGCLRSNLRPLRAGDAVLVCGRPDTGKTTFLTSELSYIAHQVSPERPILWFNNEGEGNRIIKRLYQSALDCTIDELLTQQQAGVLQDNFAATLAGRIRVVDCHDWDTKMVEAVIAETNPSLVVYDMIDNIEFAGLLTQGKNSRTDQILEEKYKWCRKTGVKYGHPMIATSQISAEVEQQPETQMWPPQHALKDSKTGKQGAVDLMIMLGKSADIGQANSRYISTPKNKLMRTSGSTEIRAQVNFDKMRGRYRDPVGTPAPSAENAAVLAALT